MADETPADNPHSDRGDSSEERSGAAELERIRAEVLAVHGPGAFESLPDPEARQVPVPSRRYLYPAEGDAGPVPLPPELPAEFLRAPTMELETWLQVWRGDVPVAITSHRGGVGAVVIWAKRVLRKFIRAPIADLFDRQRVYNAVLVHNIQALQESVRTLTERSVPALIQRGDALYAVQDQRVESVVERLDHVETDVASQLASDLYAVRDELRLADRETVALLQDGHGQLRQSLTRLQHRLDSVPPADGPVEPGRPIPPPPASAGDGDDVYLDFENLYRGDEDAIRDKQRSYLAHFRGLPGPVVDLGSGRGEFLELCREEGIAAYGVDGDANMVERCSGKGLSVERADLIAHLESIPDGSLGGIFMAQVVEHLPRPRLLRLARLAARKLAPGGRVAWETQNPLSPMVLARNFYLDLTHDRPLHPEGLRFLLEAAGFRDVAVAYLSPFSPSELLPAVKVDTSADVAPVVDALNDTVARLNQLLFGFQDFAVIGTR